MPEEHWTSLLEDNSVLHYLYNMAVGLVIYSIIALHFNLPGGNPECVSGYGDLTRCV